ncbi:MAG: pyridoxamine 5'-phosphate oxidase family protein [Acidimicrobiales bacterium]|nr:pyridoxamine 5'-phosphate oxidase family protein [Acidimicrobiales bacterium]
MTDASAFTEIAGLRQVYRMPGQSAWDKAVPRIDPAAAAFVARSPLCVIATGDGASLDASPRGGPPGFIKVLDPTHLAFGDLVGNNRIDSYSNLVQRPAIGMVLFVPGMEEVLRINGTAQVTADVTLRERCAIDGRVPKVAVHVSVVECYLHCGAALRRSAGWDPSTWPEREARPSAGRILTENLGLDDAKAEGIDAGLEEYYSTAVWIVGGGADEA